MPPPLDRPLLPYLTGNGVSHLNRYGFWDHKTLQLNLIITDTKGTGISVCIIEVSVLEK